jgi:hypothetical protein
METRTCSQELLLAIKEFTSALCDTFSPKRQSPLGRYKRILQHIKVEDKQAVSKVVNGFATFFAEQNFSEGNLPLPAIIPYKEQMYIPIGALFTEGEEEEKEVMTRHLAIIKTLCWDVPADYKAPVSTNLSLELALSKAKTNEDLVVDDVIEVIKTLISELKDMKEGESITTVAANVLQSKTFTDVFSKIQTQIEEKQIDPPKLAVKLQTALPRLIGELTAQFGTSSESAETMPKYMEAINSVMTGLAGSMTAAPPDPVKKRLRNKAKLLTETEDAPGDSNKPTQVTKDPKDSEDRPDETQSLINGCEEKTMEKTRVRGSPCVGRKSDVRDGECENQTAPTEQAPRSEDVQNKVH